MTTTRALLDAMIRSNFRRASRAGSSMHPSWLDAATLGKATEALLKKQSEKPHPDWLIKLYPSLGETSDETSAVSAEATTPTEPPVTE